MSGARKPGKPRNLAQIILGEAKADQPIEEFVDEADISKATYGNEDLSSRTFDRLNLTNIVFNACRLTSTKVERSRFKRVLFVDSELTGVTFQDCYFEECIVLGGKAASHLAFIDCALDSLTIASTTIGELEFRACEIGDLRLTSFRVDTLQFYDCDALRRAGELTIADVEVGGVAGLETLPKKSVRVTLDDKLWLSYGDLLLRQMRMNKLDDADDLTLASLADTYRQALVEDRAD